MTCAVFGTADAGGDAKSEPVNSRRSVAVRAVGVRGCSEAGMSMGSSDLERRRAAFSFDAAATPPLLVAASATSVAHASDESPPESGTSTSSSRSFTALRSDFEGRTSAVGAIAVGDSVFAAIPNALFGRPGSESEPYSNEVADCGDRKAGVDRVSPSRRGSGSGAKAGGMGEREAYMFMNSFLRVDSCLSGAAVLSGTALSMELSSGERGTDILGSVGWRMICARSLRIGAGSEGESRPPSLKLLPLRGDPSEEE